MKAQATTTRTQLLQAARQVVLTNGGTALTLDAVARAAGVSKGGLLYHFPTKEALIVAMIELLCQAFDAALEHEIACDDGPDAGRWLRAYLRVCFAPVQQELDVSAALLAAGAFDPALLGPLRERFTGWQARTEADGLDPALATAIRLAADGLWFADFGQFAPPSAAQRAAVLETLIHLTKGA